MPQIGTLIAGLVLGPGAGALATGLVSGAVDIGLSVGLSYVAKALTDKPPSAQSETAGFKAQLQAGATIPRSFIIGSFASAGSLVYHNAFGSAGKTPNAYYTQVIALSDLPVKGLTGLLVNGEAVTWTQGAAQGTDKGVAIPEYTVNGTPYLWVRFWNGKQTAPDVFLRTTFGADPDFPWEADMVGTGIAYAVVTMRYNPTLFAEDPRFLFVLDGIPLYNPRKDTSAGGKGAQRFSNPKTWVMSANPAVVLYNLLRGISFNGTWLYGLQSTPPSALPYSNWSAAINECASVVDGAAQFTCGGEILVNSQPGDAVDALLKSCNARLAEIGGTYKIHVGAAPTSGIIAFTDAALLSTEDQTGTLFPSLDSIANGITGSFISPADGWTPKPAPPRYSPGDELADGGRRIVADIDYGYVTDAAQVQRLMQSALREARRFRQHVVVAGPAFWALEPLDYVAWTSARNGYSSKLFRVDQITDKANLDVILTLSEVDHGDYAWNKSTDLFAATTSTIRIVRPPPQTIGSWSVSPQIITGDNGDQLAGIRIGWDASVDDVSGISYQVAPLDTKATAGQPGSLGYPASILLAGQTDRFDLGYLDLTANLRQKTNYQAAGRYLSRSYRDFAWSSWTPVTTGSARLDKSVKKYVDGLTNNQSTLYGLAKGASDLANDATASGKVVWISQSDVAGAPGYGVFVNDDSTPPRNLAGGFYLRNANGIVSMLLDLDFLEVARLSQGAGFGKIPLVIDVDTGEVDIDTAHVKNLTADNFEAKGLSDSQSVSYTSDVLLQTVGKTPTVVMTLPAEQVVRGTVMLFVSVPYVLTSGVGITIQIYKTVGTTKTLLSQYGFKNSGPRYSGNLSYTYPYVATGVSETAVFSLEVYSFDNSGAAELKASASSPASFTMIYVKA